MASDTDGDFVVVWFSFGSAGSDQDGSIHAQRFSADGQPASGEFQVNTYTTSFQIRPDVAIGAGGSFVVVWYSDGSFGTDNDAFSIQARRYDGDGTPLGNKFQVNTYTPGVVQRPRVDADATGRFVVVWESQGSPGTDSDQYSIQARRFAANGTPLGDQFQVNTYTTNNQNYPSVAADRDRDFTIAWASAGASQDPSGYSIQGRWYTGDGDPRGSQLQINTYTTGNQNRPSVASDAFGNTVFAWQSPGSNGGTDTSDNSIVARRYDGLFRDGFESGNTIRWSAVVP